MTSDQSVQPPEELRDGESRPESAGEVPEKPPSRGGLRSTSSKIANLRAAFEKDSFGESSPKRRFQSADRQSNETTSGRIEEHHAELARVRDELEKERELRQAFEEKCTVLEEEVEDLQEQIANRTTTAPTAGDRPEQEREQRGIQELKASADDAAVSPVLGAKQEEINSLARQLVDLKKSISSSTRIENQVSDAVFAQEMGMLHHEVQNWVVNNFRRPKSDMTVEQLSQRLDTIAEPRHLPLLKSMYQSWDPSAKMAFYQSTALCYIMEIFSEPLIFGLPAQHDWRRALRKVVEALPDFVQPTSYNHWRSFTFDMLRQSDPIAPSFESAAEGITEIICITLGALTESEDIEAWRSSLVVIVRRAITLSHLFRVQRPQYEFVLPAPGAALDPATMDDISDENGAVTAGRVVKCATFPAVFKICDENGDSPHLRNTVVKARVLCGSTAGAPSS